EAGRRRQRQGVEDLLVHESSGQTEEEEKEREGARDRAPLLEGMGPGKNQRADPAHARAPGAPPLHRRGLGGLDLDVQALLAKRPRAHGTVVRGIAVPAAARSAGAAAAVARRGHAAASRAREQDAERKQT